MNDQPLTPSQAALLRNIIKVSREGEVKRLATEMLQNGTVNRPTSSIQP